jgi:hypothetical protein
MKTNEIFPHETIPEFRRGLYSLLSLFFFLILIPNIVHGMEDTLTGNTNSDFFVEDAIEGIIPDLGCSLSNVVSQPAKKRTSNLWREIRGREMAILFVLILSAYIGKAVYLKIKQGLIGRKILCKTWSEANRAWNIDEAKKLEPQRPPAELGG